MKKFALAMALICFCTSIVFSMSKSAHAALQVPHVLPWVGANGDVYTSVIGTQHANNTYTYVYFNDPLEVTHSLNTSGFAMGTTSRNRTDGQVVSCTSSFVCTNGTSWHQAQTGTGAGIPKLYTNDYVINSENFIVYYTLNGVTLNGWKTVATGDIWQANYVQPPQLTIILDPFIGGTVTGAGISCGLDCTEAYSVNQQVTLSAQYNSGYIFQNWEIDGNPVCADPTYIVTMDQNHTVKAKFAPVFGVTVSVSAEDSGTVKEDVAQNPRIDCPGDCTESLAYNSQIILKAMPQIGYKFVRWTENDVEVSIHQTETFSVCGTRNLVAVFEPSSFKWPLTGTKSSRTILLGFGEDWIESCGEQIMKHTGIDVAAIEGETIYAAESGTVKMASLSAEWGGWVTLEHNGDSSYPYTTVYFHIIPSVSNGDPVVKGVTPLGTIFNYGGPIHLHLGIRAGAYSNTSNRGRLPQQVCGGDPAYQENFLDPQTFTYE